ncbi:hypothetical protein J6590_073278 [Homalodisca vitripennis]|nr:hypothetical protein J6590_073278 [Homalodisca vitripennis]
MMILVELQLIYYKHISPTYNKYGEHNTFCQTEANALLGGGSGPWRQIEGHRLTSRRRLGVYCWTI